MQRPLIVLLAALVVAGPALADSTPTETVQAFYAWHIKHRDAPANRSGIKKFVTAELACLEANHNRYLLDLANVYPDIKPPLAEFDLYSSLRAVPARFSLKGNRTLDDTATVQVELFLDENGVKDRKGLTSTVQLRKYAGSWIISDIVYAYKQPAFDATRLRALLYEEMGRDDPNIGWRASAALECQQRPGPAWAWQ